MKLKTIVAPQFSEALNRLAKAEVPVVVAYKLKTVIAKCLEEQKKFEDFRMALINKHAPKDEGGEIIKGEDGSYSVPESTKEAFLQEVAELLDIEIELAKIKVESLGSKIQITTLDLILLGDLLEE